MRSDVNLVILSALSPNADYNHTSSPIRASSWRGRKAVVTEDDDQISRVAGKWAIVRLDPRPANTDLMR